MPTSTALSQELVTRAIGYKLKPGNFNPTTPYLPQRIAVLGEGNTANQGTMVDGVAFEFISAKEVADEFGFGSPLHQMARILRPLSGNPLGGIPTVIYPQLEAGAATAGILKMGITIATTVTENATHKLIINGRDNIDGKFYSYSVVAGEDAAAVRQKIIDAVSNVLSAPVTAVESTLDVDLTSKWLGGTAILSLDVDVQGKAAGIVYSEVSNTDGTGTADLTAALDNFGETWNTLVINPYGEDQFTVLEAFNGIPDPDAPTGRYDPVAFFPLVALYGSSLSDKDDVVAVTNLAARRTQVTNVHCPAPNSSGFPWEAAANMIMTWAPKAQNSPHGSNGGKQYPDMPVPTDENIGDFSDITARNFMATKGSSTVNLSGGKYTVQDFFTTYAPDGDPLPKFRFARDLNIDWNYEFNWKLVVLASIQDKTIRLDNSPSSVDGTITPSGGKQLLISHIESMELLALIADSAFSIESIVVGISGTNPARLDFFNRYKRTSTAHQVSTDSEVDFNFST